MEPGQPSHVPAHPPGRQHLLLPGLSAPFLTLTLQHERSEGIPKAKPGLIPACFTSPGGTNLLPRSASCTWLPDTEHPSVLSHRAQALALPVTSFLVCSLEQAQLSCLSPLHSLFSLPAPSLPLPDSSLLSSRCQFQCHIREASWSARLRCSHPSLHLTSS
jgi:hypothetical protein